MPTLSITKNYANTTVLTEGQLDDIKTSIETFVNTTKLDSQNIQTGGIATANFATGAVDSAAIASSAVTTVKIADSNVTTAKIADSNVTTAKIANSGVTTAKILDANVTTAKIADANVTAAKIATGTITGTQLSSTISLPVGSTVNSKYPVVSNTAPASTRLCIIRGRFDSSGTLLHGEGCTVASHPSGGLYNITYTTSIPDIAAVIATPEVTVPNYYFIGVSSQGTGGVTISIRNSAGTGTDLAFSFIAIGICAT